VSHSYSGKAENIKLNPVPGGAWTEALANGGFVTHLVVSQASPGERLVLNGGLGPLAFMGVSGAMTITFTKSPGWNEGCPRLQRGRLRQGGIFGPVKCR
jgi:hypothetical protein